MRIAVISDVHANLHALEAVLADVERISPDAIWSLGDVVGYGPQPSPCCALVAARADISLIGNHDLASLGRLELDDFSNDAAQAARWTAAHLAQEARDYLVALQPTAETPEAALYHGSPRDPVWEYVLSVEAALAALQLAPRPLVLVGHSHVPLALRLDEEVNGGLAPESGLAPDGTGVDLNAPGRWLLNPGSVGQPRDGDPRAAWLFLDFQAGNGTFRRVEYDIEATQREIMDAGLAENLAARLAEGV